MHFRHRSLAEGWAYANGRRLRTKPLKGLWHSFPLSLDQPCCCGSVGWQIHSGCVISDAMYSNSLTPDTVSPLSVCSYHIRVIRSSFRPERQLDAALIHVERARGFWGLVCAVAIQHCSCIKCRHRFCCDWLNDVTVLTVDILSKASSPFSRQQKRRLPMPSARSYKSPLSTQS